MVARHDTDQTHPNLHPHTGVRTSHTGTNTPPLAGDDCRFAYSIRAVQIRVGLELADFQLSKQQSRTQTTSSTVLGTPLSPTQTNRFP